MGKKQEHFGKWLQRVIQDRMLTIKAFANLSGLDESTLFLIFRKAQPNLRPLTIVAIAKALEIPREEIEQRLGARVAA